MKPVHETKYQVSSMDGGSVEVLYEGNWMKEAAQAALAHPGKCSIHHYRFDGTVRTVAEFKNGRMTDAYIY